VAEWRRRRRERRAIYESWRRVPFRTRIEVLRLAKSGERHPDPTVDAVAVRFAHSILEQPSFLYTTAFQTCLSLGLLAFALVVDDTFPRWCAGIGGGLCLFLTVFNWDLKRDARKILSVPRDEAPLVW
jgi:hypothetical protein